MRGKSHPLAAENGFTCLGRFNRNNVDVHKYSKQMSKPVSSPYVDSLVKYVLESQGFVPEIQPANLYDPEKMAVSLFQNFGSPDVRVVKDEAYLKAFSKTFAIFARKESEPYLRPLTDEQIPSALKMEKSAGLPYGMSKMDALSDAYRRMKQVLRREKAPNPATSYARTSAGGKTRLVWGYPMEMTMIEARFARPVIDKYRFERITPMAFAKTKAFIGAKVRYTIGQSPAQVFALDYSKFDSSISSDLITAAFSILETWFSKQDREAFGWDLMVHYFLRTPIIFVDGKLYVGKVKGVPSGSFWTQIVDSIVNVLVLQTVAFRNNTYIDTTKLLVLGDDSIFSITGISVDQLAVSLKELGITVNVEKTMINELHFLGAYWRNGFSDRPIHEMVEHMVCPERHRHKYYKGANSKERLYLARNILKSYAAIYESGIVFVRGVHPDAKNWALDRFLEKESFGYLPLHGIDEVLAREDPRYREQIQHSWLSERLLR